MFTFGIIFTVVAVCGLMVVCGLIHIAIQQQRVYMRYQAANRLMSGIIRDHLIWPETPQWNTCLYSVRTEFKRFIQQIHLQETYWGVADKAVPLVEEMMNRYIDLLVVKVNTPKPVVDCKV